MYFAVANTEAINSGFEIKMQQGRPQTFLHKIMENVVCLLVNICLLKKNENKSWRTNSFVTINQMENRFLEFMQLQTKR